MNKVIEEALQEVTEQSSRKTDGKWLERLTAGCANLIAEWDVFEAWEWEKWPEKQHYYPNTPDVGIDVVAKRKSDGKFIAIQCKSRKLDEDGQGININKKEIDSFFGASAVPLWVERWLVVNGDVDLGSNARKTLGIDSSKPIKPINIETDLLKQKELNNKEKQENSCPHCTDGIGKQTRDCMQREAIEKSTVILRQHAEANKGKARGRIILPCGAGKSRIALRIIENLTESGQVAVVLCPSIALVAQLRSEFLGITKKHLKVLAVCSDETAARGSDLSKDPTADLGHATAAEVKGTVTTDPDEVREWISDVCNTKERIGVIFGTYQSSHRIAEALNQGFEIQVMVADEAHRTAGLRRTTKVEDEKKIKDFTICHDNLRFPAKYRIYQTATPRVYSPEEQDRKMRKNDNWIVRDMADEEIFGPELYRRSYKEAVENDWLTDYRIIAIGVNDEDAYKTANNLAAKTKSKKLSTAHFLRGLVLALVMGGSLRRNGVQIHSSINFMNLVDNSKKMADALKSNEVKDWVKRRLKAEGEQTISDYMLEHLDAKSRVADREHAKARLMGATKTKPHGVLNVGIFGEGVDTPALSAVGFLEARRSPVDVIQAVGRVMRRAEGKEMGYIICPILIPPRTDAETWLRNSGPEDGWRELGQILLALRAHDGRIEDQLSELMQLYLPPPIGDEDVATMVVIGGENRRAQYYGHHGKSGSVETDTEQVLLGQVKPKNIFLSLEKVIPADTKGENSLHAMTAERIVSGKVLEDGSIELRETGIERDRAKTTNGGMPGPINIEKSKKTARKMLNGEVGRKINVGKKDNTQKSKQEQQFRTLFDEVNDLDIQVNLLEKSGLGRNRAERDVNILEDSISEAKRCLKGDELDALLDRYFGLDRLDERKRKDQADGCTIAALLLMNASMLHQRIAAGGWLPGIEGLNVIKSLPEVIDELLSQWNRITRHDFLPVVEPAIEIIEEIRKSGKRVGLNRALRHLAGEAEHIAESYADLGADHAGPLFNKVMGNQASDGAYFTRPTAAALLARLTLDVRGTDLDWKKNDTWKNNRIVDLACGSGTLLAAMLTDMKRRASEQGAGKQRLAELQKLAVEEVISGLDFNPVSLQLAAAQLTTGNRNVAYRKMQLYRMPYGPTNTGDVKVGSLELLGQSQIVPRYGELALEDEHLDIEQLKISTDDPLLEDAVKSVKNVRIVIMNPPFSSRVKMGEKFTHITRKEMRLRVDGLEIGLTRSDLEMEKFADKRSIGPLFPALAERCLDSKMGILSMINPTIALTNPSGLQQRIILAKRFHIHTLLTCHLPGQINLSQNTNINESIVIATRFEGPKPPTRIISLDRLPITEQDVDEFHNSLLHCKKGLIPNGWGEVFYWPTERIEAGDWSAAVWRSPKLAEAGAEFSGSDKLIRLCDHNISPAKTSPELHMRFKVSFKNAPGSFPILKSKGADGQKYIKGRPDEYWIPKEPFPNGGMIKQKEEHFETKKLLKKAGYLLVSFGQDTRTARLTAVVCDQPYVGDGWMPVKDLPLEQAKAAAVFLNSTIGRIQIMTRAGKKLEFPVYNPAAWKQVKIPDLSDERISKVLADTWKQTSCMEIPQFRDGECEVRRIWDEAVALAMGLNSSYLAELRSLLHNEPHVKGLGLNQYGDLK
ncbi:MAG: DEAD/DEAH box helicase family protein [Gammaproteobacteria bacterium]|nr:DEAD/DEAH box helicase family protein [Gammaproteobacteria bacterium]